MATDETAPTDLRALCEAGARSAFHALGRMLAVEERHVSLVTPPPTGPAPFAVRFELHGGVSGTVTLVLSGKDARRTARRLLGSAHGDELDATARAALAEAANITVSAFLGPLADALRKACYPSVPELDAEVERAPLVLGARLGDAAPLVARLGIDLALPA